MFQHLGPPSQSGYCPGTTSQSGYCPGTTSQSGYCPGTTSQSTTPQAGHSKTEFKRQLNNAWIVAGRDNPSKRAGVVVIDRPFVSIDAPAR